MGVTLKSNQFNKLIQSTLFLKFNSNKTTKTKQYS